MSKSINQEKELFDLCKQVYDATGWGMLETPKRYRLHGRHQRVADWPSGKLGGYSTPLYTSDYLLEKLPKRLPSGFGDELYETHISVETPLGSPGTWQANLEDNYGNGDTPLKALLQLTLALHEAGELL